MKTERSEGHHEAAKALALSVLGVMAIILIWNLVMLALTPARLGMIVARS